MTLLNRTTANIPVQHPVKIIQFGGGNFLRAFADWMFDVLNKETDFKGSVAIIKPTKRGDYDALKKQEGLFHVALEGLVSGTLVSETQLITSVSKIIQPYTQWNDYLALAEQPDVRFVVSNTTESGIKFSENDLKTETPPHEFPAKLTLWLYHRFNFFKGAKDKGCILLPCELIEDNGAVLQQTILDYAKHWNLDEQFSLWIQKSNYFCNTLVDRIVSGYPTAKPPKLAFTDTLLVAGEYYHSWVLQAPKWVQEELPFANTNLNVQFVDDLKAYREIKVRVLNGAHTILVPVGYLFGIDKVREAVTNTTVGAFLKEALYNEICPTLAMPKSDVDAFAKSVLDRFKNPSIEHALLSISLNSIAKFKTRVLPSVLAYIAQNNTVPKALLFSLASLLVFYKGTRDKETILLKDDIEVLTFFKEQWGHQTVEVVVKNTLSHTAFWGLDLTSFLNLETTVAMYVNVILKDGMQVSLRNFLNQK